MGDAMSTLRAAMSLRQRIGLVNAKGQPDTLRLLGVYRTARNQGHSVRASLAVGWKCRNGGVAAYDRRRRRAR
jgi:hypothetical protein